MIVIPKTTLRIANAIRMPGEEVDVPDALAKKLLGAGLVTATVEPQENAAMPKAKSRKAGAKSGAKSNNRSGG